MNMEVDRECVMIKETMYGLLKDMDCPICLEIVEEPLSTPCHHQFCRCCLETLLKTSKSNEVACPMCKSKITKRGLRERPGVGALLFNIKELAKAIKEDSGMDITPPRKYGISSKSENIKKILNTCGQSTMDSLEPLPDDRIMTEPSTEKTQNKIRPKRKKLHTTSNIYKDDIGLDSYTEIQFKNPVGNTNIQSGFPASRDKIKEKFPNSGPGKAIIESVSSNSKKEIPQTSENSPDADKNCNEKDNRDSGIISVTTGEKTLGPNVDDQQNLQTSKAKTLEEQDKIKDGVEHVTVFDKNAAFNSLLSSLDMDSDEIPKIKKTKHYKAYKVGNKSPKIHGNALDQPINYNRKILNWIEKSSWSPPSDTSDDMNGLSKMNSSDETEHLLSKQRRKRSDKSEISNSITKHRKLNKAPNDGRVPIYMNWLENNESDKPNSLSQDTYTFVASQPSPQVKKKLTRKKQPSIKNKVSLKVITISCSSDDDFVDSGPSKTSSLLVETSSPDISSRSKGSGIDQCGTSGDEGMIEKAKCDDTLLDTNKPSTSGWKPMEHSTKVSPGIEDKTQPSTMSVRLIRKVANSSAQNSSVITENKPVFPKIDPPSIPSPTISPKTQEHDESPTLITVEHKMPEIPSKKSRTTCVKSSTPIRDRTSLPKILSKTSDRMCAAAVRVIINESDSEISSIIPDNTLATTLVSSKPSEKVFQKPLSLNRNKLQKPYTQTTGSAQWSSSSTYDDDDLNIPLEDELFLTPAVNLAAFCAKYGHRDLIQDDDPEPSKLKPKSPKRIKSHVLTTTKPQKKSMHKREDNVPSTQEQVDALNKEISRIENYVDPFIIEKVDSFLPHLPSKPITSTKISSEIERNLEHQSKPETENLHDPVITTKTKNNHVLTATGMKNCQDPVKVSERGNCQNAQIASETEHSKNPQFDGLSSPEKIHIAQKKVTFKSPFSTTRVPLVDLVNSPYKFHRSPVDRSPAKSSRLIDRSLENTMSKTLPFNQTTKPDSNLFEKQNSTEAPSIVRENKRTLFELLVPTEKLQDTPILNNVLKSPAISSSLFVQNIVPLDEVRSPVFKLPQVKHSELQPDPPTPQNNTKLMQTRQKTPKARTSQAWLNSLDGILSAQEGRVQRQRTMKENIAHSRNRKLTDENAGTKCDSSKIFIVPQNQPPELEICDRDEIMNISPKTSAVSSREGISELTCLLEKKEISCKDSISEEELSSNHEVVELNAFPDLQNQSLNAPSEIDPKVASSRCNDEPDGSLASSQHEHVPFNASTSDICQPKYSSKQDPTTKESQSAKSPSASEIINPADIKDKDSHEPLKSKVDLLQDATESSEEEFDVDASFQKPSRKTFDLEATTQELEALEGGLDTLDLIKEICADEQLRLESKSISSNDSDHVGISQMTTTQELTPLAPCIKHYDLFASEVRTPAQYKPDTVRVIGNNDSEGGKTIHITKESNNTHQIDQNLPVPPRDRLGTSQRSNHGKQTKLSNAQLLEMTIKVPVSLQGNPCIQSNALCDICCPKCQIGISLQLSDLVLEINNSGEWSVKSCDMKIKPSQGNPVETEVQAATEVPSNATKIPNNNINPKTVWFSRPQHSQAKLAHSNTQEKRTALNPKSNSAVLPVDQDTMDCWGSIPEMQFLQTQIVTVEEKSNKPLPEQHDSEDLWGSIEPSQLIVTPTKDELLVQGKDKGLKDVADLAIKSDSKDSWGSVPSNIPLSNFSPKQADLVQKETLDNNDLEDSWGSFPIGVASDQPIKDDKSNSHFEFKDLFESSSANKNCESKRKMDSPRKVHKPFNQKHSELSKAGDVLHPIVVELSKTIGTPLMPDDTTTKSAGSLHEEDSKTAKNETSLIENVLNVNDESWDSLFESPFSFNTPKEKENQSIQIKRSQENNCTFSSTNNMDNRLLNFKNICTSKLSNENLSGTNNRQDPFVGLEKHSATKPLKSEEVPKKSKHYESNSSDEETFGTMLIQRFGISKDIGDLCCNVDEASRKKNLPSSSDYVPATEEILPANDILGLPDMDERLENLLNTESVDEAHIDMADVDHFVAGLRRAEDNVSRAGKSFSRLSKRKQLKKLGKVNLRRITQSIKEKKYRRIVQKTSSEESSPEKMELTSTVEEPLFGRLTPSSLTDAKSASSPILIDIVNQSDEDINGESEQKDFSFLNTEAAMAKVQANIDADLAGLEDFQSEPSFDQDSANETGTSLKDSTEDQVRVINSIKKLKEKLEFRNALERMRKKKAETIESPVDDDVLIPPTPPDPKRCKLQYDKVK